MTGTAAGKYLVAAAGASSYAYLNKTARPPNTYQAAKIPLRRIKFEDFVEQELEKALPEISL